MLLCEFLTQWRVALVLLPLILRGGGEESLFTKKPTLKNEHSFALAPAYYCAVIQPAKWLGF